MKINNFELKVTMVAYDGCHKIYLPVEGQEKLFIKSMLKKGWILENDFYRIESAKELMDMYLDSCPLRFIEQIDCSGKEAVFTSIIPQGAFCVEEGFFDENLAKLAFVEN